jgi:hypothetical protein
MKYVEAGGDAIDGCGQADHGVSAFYGTFSVIRRTHCGYRY